MSSIVEMKNVYKSFGPVEVLKDFSLKLAEGEKVVIIGPSGSGKSTVLRCINRLETIQGGQIFFEGQAIDEKSDLCALRTHIGMVFQRFNLFPHKTALENIIEALLIVKKMSRPEAEKIAEALLDRVGLVDKRDSYPRELSGGQQQRVAIARALANDPEVLLMDEPFGALDAQTRSVMQELLLSVWDESHKTILFVTHDVEEAVFIGDTIYVMTARPGRIKAKIDVKLPTKRTYDMKLSEEFLGIKRDVLELIREEAWKAANANLPEG